MLGSSHSNELQRSSRSKVWPVVHLTQKEHQRPALAFKPISRHVGREGAAYAQDQ